MKAGIAFKLFLVILAASAVAAGAMALATRASFQSGFLGYLNHVDAQRIDALAGRLADEYRRAVDEWVRRPPESAHAALALVEFAGVLAADRLTSEVLRDTLPSAEMDAADR